MELYGIIPSINNSESNIKCNFSGTELCLLNDKTYNSECNYSGYNCTNCTDNSYIENNICKCKDGYVGIGYIECKNKNNTDQGILKLHINK